MLERLVAEVKAVGSEGERIEVRSDCSFRPVVLGSSFAHSFVDSLIHGRWSPGPRAGGMPPADRRTLECKKLEIVAPAAGLIGLAAAARSAYPTKKH